MKQTFRYGLVIVVIAGAALLRYYSNSRTEARYLRDFKTVSALANNMSTHAPQGFESYFPHSKPGPSDLTATETNVPGSVHSGHGWEGVSFRQATYQVDSFRQAVYKVAAAPAGGTNPPVDAAVLLKHYFGDLERSGFTSGETGFGTTATTDSTEVARKYWYNWNRSLIVQGQIVRNRASGEIIASVSYWGTLNYRPH